MSFKDLFFTVKESEGNEKKKEVSKTAEPVVTSTAPIYTAASNFQNNSTGTVDQALIEKLQGIFDQANMPGPDLHEFILSLKKFDGKPMDEKTKYEVVFDAQSSVGLTKTKLIDSGQFYITTFNDVKGEFDKEYQAEMASTVTNLNAQADGIITENDNLRKSIEEINTKIQANLTKMQTLRNEASTNENKLMQNKMTFESTYTTFVAGIQKYIDGVKAYIK